MPPRFKKVGYFLIGVSLVILLLQPVMRWAANYYLTNKARLPVRVGSLFINPATSRVSVGLQGAKPDQILTLDLGVIRFDWWNLILKRLRLGQVRLENAHFSIRKDAQGRVFVSDIELSATSTPVEKKPEPASEDDAGWGIGLGRVDVSTVTVLYQDPAMNVELIVQRLTVEPMESWRPQRDSRFEADLLLQGAPLKIRGTLRPFAKTVRATGRLELSPLSLKWLTPALASADISHLDGSLAAGIDFDVQADPATQTTIVNTSGDLATTSVTVRGSVLPITEVGFSGPVRWRSVEMEASSTTLTRLRFEQLAIGPGARMDVVDLARPVFRYTFSPIELAAGPGRLFDAQPRIPFELLAPSRAGGTIRLKGEAAPLAFPPDGDLKLAIEKLNLTPWSPMLEKKTSYRIASGQYTMNTEAAINRGALDSTTRLDADAFYLKKLRAEERDETMESIGLPLGLGLALLRDADDHIRLEVPVQGELTDPKVPVGRLVWTFIQKALAAAVRNAAAAFFPGDGPVRLPQVTFAPNNSVLTPEAQSYLQELGQNMAKRPQVAIRITAKVTPSDYAALTRKKLPEGAAPFDWAALKPSDKTRLREMASARAQAVQEFLMRTAGIHASRLVLEPAEEDPDLQSPPRVVFGF